MKLPMTKCFSFLSQHRIPAARFLLLLLLIPAVIPGQIPGLIDLCCLIIQGGLEANRVIAELEIAAPLKTINEIHDKLLQFEQEIYSLASLSAIKSFLGSVGTMISSWKAILVKPVN